MVSYAAVSSRKTTPVFSVFSNPLAKKVLKAVTWSQCRLIDTEKVFHSCGDSLQDGAFQQLVKYAQE